MQTHQFLLALAVAVAIPQLADAKPPTNPELTACIGGKGPAMPIFSKVKRGMTVAEVAAVWPGADKLDKFGFAKVAAKDCVGADKFVFYFQKDLKTNELALYSAEIEFDKALTGDADFYQRVTTLLVAKYGPLKNPEKDLAKRILTWVTKDGIAQFFTLGDRNPFRLKGTLPR
jgi:hypothetical protein